MVSSLLTGIVSYFKYDTNNSTQPDEVGGHDGTVSGAVFTSSGKINGGYDYTGDYINYGYHYSLPNGSISVWIKSSGDGDTMYVLGQQDHPATLTAFIDSTNKVNFWVRNKANTVSVTIVSDQVVSNNWEHYVFTWGSNGVRMYRDKIYVAYNSSNVYEDGTTTSFFTGTVHAGIATANQYTGDMDELGIWSKQLSDGGINLTETATGEVEELYNSGVGLQYPFLETSADNAIFASMNQ